MERMLKCGKVTVFFLQANKTIIDERIFFCGAKKVLEKDMISFSRPKLSGAEKKNCVRFSWSLFKACLGKNLRVPRVK